MRLYVKEKTHTNYNAWQFNLYHHLSDSVEQNNQDNIWYLFKNQIGQFV